MNSSRGKRERNFLFYIFFWIFVLTSTLFLSRAQMRSSGIHTAKVLQNAALNKIPFSTTPIRKRAQLNDYWMLRLDEYFGIQSDTFEDSHLNCHISRHTKFSQMPGKMPP
jgi:hypothetical protein